MAIGGVTLCAIACTEDETSASEDGGAGGVGGTSVGTGGREKGNGSTGGSRSTSAGSGGVADEDGGASGAGGAAVCSGSIPPTVIQPGSKRYEQEQCYLTEPQSGEPDCLADDANGLNEKLSDFIFSAGFRSEFVIDSADTVAVPWQCEALIRCCEENATDSDGNSPFYGGRCFDDLDRQTPPTAEYCQQRFDAYQNDGYCATVDPGTPDGPQRALCCYNTCGYTHYT